MHTHNNTVINIVTNTSPSLGCLWWDAIPHTLLLGSHRGIIPQGSLHFVVRVCTRVCIFSLLSAVFFQHIFLTHLCCGIHHIAFSLLCDIEWNFSSAVASPAEFWMTFVLFSLLTFVLISFSTLQICHCLLICFVRLHFFFRCGSELAEPKEQICLHFLK